MDCILKTNNITKIYGSQKAVDNACMTINKGDIYGFVGQNGSGKTTIIRMITGLIGITSGDYELFGISSKSKDIYDARKKIGAIVENPSIYQNMTANDNLILQCELYDIKDKSCIDEILDVVGLSQVKGSKKHVKDFSLGMRQRLAIGMCLVSKPELLVLDEPTNGLDPEGVIELRNLLIKLNKERNITILISSHILSELSKIATKYGIIHHGRLIKEITSEEIMENVNKFTTLKVNKIGKTSKVLDSLGINDYKIDDNLVEIKGHFNITDLVLSLAKQDVSIEDIDTNTQSIEDYYMKMVGGKSHA